MSIQEWSDEFLLDDCHGEDEHALSKEVVRLRGELRVAKTYGPALVAMTGSADDLARAYAQEQALRSRMATERDVALSQVAALRHGVGLLEAWLCSHGGCICNCPVNDGHTSGCLVSALLQDTAAAAEARDTRLAEASVAAGIMQAFVAVAAALDIPPPTSTSVVWMAEAVLSHDAKTWNAALAAAADSLESHRQRAFQEAAASVRAIAKGETP